MPNHHFGLVSKFVLAAALLSPAKSIAGTASRSGAKSAQKAHSVSLAQEDIDSDLVESELLSGDEEAPPAEYPYPGAKEEGIVKTAPAPEIQRPVRIDEETGYYIYDTKVETQTAHTARGVKAPKKVLDGGTYVYDDKEEPVKFSGRAGVEAPASIKANGEFTYATEPSPRTASISVRLGLFGPPGITNEQTKPDPTPFEAIYKNAHYPVLFADYEKLLTTKVGRLGLKFGSGVFAAQGDGIFAKRDPDRRKDDIPQEQYTFLMFPNQLTAIYRFQYADTQPIVPYVEGGAGYFTFIEMRDDNKSTKFGGAATAVAAAGVNFLIDWLDPAAIRRLDNDYGINHVWLTSEFRRIQGLNKNYDFSSSVINLGVMTEF